MKRDIITSIRDIGLCLQTMIKTRYKKKTKPIYTNGKYKSLFISFYKNQAWQFYVQDKSGYYLICLLRNERLVRKDIVRREELIERFYQKMIYFFRIIN